MQEYRVKLADYATVEMGRRNYNAPHHWEVLDMDSYIVDKPVVFCLGGNGTITNQSANGLAKNIENYLDLLFKDKQGKKPSEYVDIISFKYAIPNERDLVGSLTDLAIEQIVDIMLPLFKNENDEKIDLNIAKKNMSRITFFSYCLGAEELEKVISKLNSQLEILGYTKQEILDINNSTMHISFAPYSYDNNSLPSVRFISARDDVVANCFNGMIPKEKRLEVDGIYFHRDEAGKLYGLKREDATAGSIEVLTGNLVNSFPLILDEHNFYFVTRDRDWNINEYDEDGEMLKGDNGDCVSQMIAWALCRGVENSLQNMKSDFYIPNNFNGDLIDELKSIRSSFTTEQLATNETFKSGIRRDKFNEIRNSKIKEQERLMNDFIPSESLVYSELKRAKTFEDVFFVCEKNNYYYINEYLDDIDFITDDERKIINTAYNKKISERLKKEYSKMPFKDLIQLFNSLRNLEEIEKLANLIGLAYMLDLIPALLNIPESERGYNLTQEEATQIIKNLKEKETFNTTKSKADLITYMLTKLEGSQLNFENIIKIFEEYDYFGVLYFLPLIIDGLSDSQLKLIKKVERLKKYVVDERMDSINFPTYEEMIDRINNANSLDDIIEYLKKYNYVGVEYILPELQVLTEREKDYILTCSGKKVSYPQLNELFE